MKISQRRKSGVALIAVLSMVAAIGAIVASISEYSRDARSAALNRSNFIRAQWAADACASIAVAATSELLGAAQSPGAVHVAWTSLDALVSHAQLPGDMRCGFRMAPAGVTVNINDIGEHQLRALVCSVEPAEQCDSLSDALLDWRDPDDSTRAHGAESAWYAAMSRPYPTNKAFIAVQEARLVRGWEHADSVVALLSADNDPVVLDRAARSVLATIDGLDAEAIEWIDSHRAELRGRDVSVMFDRLSLPSRTLLTNHYAQLRMVTSSEPAAWYVDCFAPISGDHNLHVRLRIVRAAGAVRVVARRESYP